MQTYTDQYVAALRMGCERALELLENPDADHFDADKVIHLLTTILEAKPC